MPLPKTAYQVMLSPVEKKHLDTLADIQDMSRSAVVRRLVQAAANHILYHKPTCASCEPCRCPNMIQYQGQPHDDSNPAT